MTFLWSQIPFDTSAISLRYYNDLWWYFYNSIQVLPNFIIGFYKLRKFIRNRKTQTHWINDKSSWDNRITMIFTILVPIYYLFDFLISIKEGTFYYPCRFGLWYHHVISMVVIPLMVYKRIYEWYEMFILGTHSLLMWFPHIFLLNIIYILWILIFNYNLYFKPLNQRWENRFLGKFFPFIYFSFIVMLDCDDGINGLPYLY